jgi:hypothetical protein
MMKEHRQAVISQLGGLTGPARALFGLFAAERLRGCCWVAHHGTKVWETFTESLEKAFCLLEHIESFDELISSLEEIVPEGGGPLQVQGQCAVVCLLESVKLLTHPDTERIEAVVNAVVDALDNYTFFARRLITGDLSSPDEYPLLNRELEKQEADLQFVAGDPSAEAVRQWRIENLQFAVPAAVG